MKNWVIAALVLLAACGGGGGSAATTTTERPLSNGEWLNEAKAEMRLWDKGRIAVLDALIAKSPTLRDAAVEAATSARRFRITLPEIEEVSSEDQDEAEILVETLEDYEEVARDMAANPRGDFTLRFTDAVGAVLDAINDI